MGKADCSFQGQKGPRVLLFFSYSFYFTKSANQGDPEMNVFFNSQIRMGFEVSKSGHYLQLMLLVRLKRTAQGATEASGKVPLPFTLLVSIHP